MLFFIQVFSFSSLGTRTRLQIGLGGSYRVPPYTEANLSSDRKFRRLSAFKQTLILRRVETSRNAGLEVQATTIAFKPTPGVGESQWEVNCGKTTVPGPEFETYASDQWCDIARWKSSAVVT